MPARASPCRPVRQPGSLSSWIVNLQIQECAQDAAHGGQLIGRDGAKTAVKTLICHRPRVFGPGEGGKLAQARRLRSDRNLVTKAPIPARDGYHQYDRMRQRQVQRAGNDDDRAPTSLFRSDDGIQVGQPHVTRTQWLAHSSPSPSPTVWSHSASSLTYSAHSCGSAWSRA